MAIGVTVDWPTGVISVPRTGMTLVQTVPSEIRELSLNDFRLELKSLEDDKEGMTWTKTHNHNTEVSLGGITYARVIEILDPYSITFEDGQYAVNLVGANTNVGDKINLNQVSVRSSNSAGLISSPDIEYASFNGGVMINVDTGVVGTTYPTGTQRRKSNNVPDAFLIAEYRGFRKFFLDSDLVLSSTEDLTNFTLQGNSRVNTSLHIEASANVQNCIFEEVLLSGILDGGSTVLNSNIGDIDVFNGAIWDSGLIGTIKLAGELPAAIINSNQTLFDSTPIIDMGGWGQDLIMTDYTGRILIQNLTGSTTLTGVTTEIGIGLDHGQVVLDSTSVTQGTVWVSGIGQLVDENGESILSGTWNGGVTIINQLLNRETISEANQLGTAVYINTGSTITGTSFPAGSKRTPVNNLSDAITIAENEGLDRIIFLSDYFFPDGTNINGYYLEGEGFLTTTFTFQTLTGGCIVNRCTFRNATLIGEFSGVESMIECRINNLGSIGLIPSSQEILVKNCFINGIISLPSNYSGKITVVDSYSNVVGAATPTLDFGNCAANLQVRNYTGGMRFTNLTQGNVVSFDLVSGQLKLDPATVTNGTIVVRGSGKLINSDTSEIIYSGVWNGGVTVLSEANTPIQTAKQVWDEPVGEHLLSGTTGLVLGLNQFGGSVHIDPTNGVPGTSFPIGTERVPVNNLADAKTIATERGINVFDIVSTLTLNPGDNVSGYTLKSENNSSIILEPGCITFYTNFMDVSLSGITNGYVIISRGSISELNEFYGIMQDVVQNGSIKISSDNTKNAIIIDHTTGNVAGPPEINLNGDGAKLSLRGLTGAARFTNKTGTTQGAFIDLYSARVGFDSTITAGNFTVRGVGYIYLNNSTNTTFDTTGLMSKNTVSEAVWDEPLEDHVLSGTTGRVLSKTAFNGKVWMDSVVGVSGQTFPIGTEAYPSSFGADALAIANREGIKEFRLSGSFTSTQNVTGYTIGGDTWLDDTFILNGTSYDYLTFRDLYITGSPGALGENIQYKNCYIKDITNIAGEMIGCRLKDNISVAPGQTLSGVELVVEGDFTTIDLQGVSGTTVSLDINSGYVLFTNSVPGCLIELNLKGGEIELDPSCTGGDFYAEGIGTLYGDPEALGMNVKANNLIDNTTIRNTVWNAPLTGHTEPGSMGLTLSGSTAQEVWNYPLP